MATLDLQIAASADDAQETAGTMSINGTTISNDLDMLNEYAGVRFTGAGALVGATITASYLTVQMTGSGTDEPDVTIKGHKVAAAPTFTTGASNISDRYSGSPTIAAVTWSNLDLGLAAGNDTNSPSLNAIISELAAQPAWDGSIVLLLKGNADQIAGLGDFSFKLFDGPGGAPTGPRLHIEYTPAAAGGGGNQRLLLVGVG